MQITINLPDKLTEEVQKQTGDVSGWIVKNLVLEAMKTGLITFDEFKDLLIFNSEDELNAFLRQNNLLHDGGLLNLAGSCADIDFDIDDLESINKISEDISGKVDGLKFKDWEVCHG